MRERCGDVPIRSCDGDLPGPIGAEGRLQALPQIRPGQRPFGQLGLDLVEEATREEDGGRKKKGYRIRYGNLKKAWAFTETNVEVAMQNYAKSVEHLQNLVEERKW